MADSPFALRLSHAGDWVECSAYPEMNSRPEAAVIEAEADHTIREEGTAMHACAYPGGLSVGDVAPNGVLITDELLDGALFYLDVLDSYPDVVWTMEQTLPAPMIHRACGGTPDAYGAFIANRPRPRVIVPDFKGGFGPVEVFPNYQLIGYASAVTTHLGLDGVDCEYEFVIVQPRAVHRDGPVRKHVMTSAQIEPYWNKMRVAAAVAMGDHARAVAGPQCDNCNMRHACEVAIKAGHRAQQIAGEANIVTLTPQALDYELMRAENAMRMLQARITGMQAQAVHMMRAGANLTHYAMERGNGRLSWIDDAAEAQAVALGEMLGKDLRKPQRAITPTQASKIIDPALIKGMTHRPRGEAKLVRFDPNAATKAFSHLGVK